MTDLDQPGHQHGKGSPGCVQPFDLLTLLEACECAAGNARVTVANCTCADCYQIRRQTCNHPQIASDVYGYRECRTCGADEESEVNPIPGPTLP